MDDRERRPPGGAFPPTLKRFGQHFLTDRRILARIADAVAPDDATVLEIGPGRGALTDLLAPRAARLVAVELDRALAGLLRDRYAGNPRVEIVEGDVLEHDLAALVGGPFALVGNVPYYITTPILFHALRPPRPTRMVFLVQREVAERLAAPPGGKDYGALTVNAQTFATVELLFRVAPGAFAPPPKVESAVVRLTPRTEPLLPAEWEEGYRRFVQSAFALRRKQLKRVLRSVAALAPADAERVLVDADVDPAARSETLGVAEWVRLYGRLTARS